MHAVRALLFVALLVSWPLTVAAQVRTRAVDVHWYRAPQGLPASLPPAGPTSLVSVDCARDVSPPFRATRCRVVPAATANRGAELLGPITRCYGSRGVAPSAPPGNVVTLLVRALETSHSDADTIAVALPPSAQPTLVLVRWRDEGRGMRCARWTRHCTGIDCNMVAARRFCAQDVEVATHERTIAWGWVEAGTMRLTTSPPLMDTAARVERFESVTADASDPSADRATLGARAHDELASLASTTTDPVLRYAAWVNLAVDAWAGGAVAELTAAIEHATLAEPAALAAFSAIGRDALAAPLASLHRVDGWREGASIVSPCPP